MPNLIVVDDPRDWPAEIGGARVVGSAQYLTDDEFSRGRGLRVFNLCASYRYQHYGYYVSLLATARDHRPLPDVATIQDIKTRTLLRLASDELDDVIHKSLHALESDAARPRSTMRSRGATSRGATSAWRAPCSTCCPRR